MNRKDRKKSTEKEREKKGKEKKNSHYEQYLYSRCVYDSSGNDLILAWRRIFGIFISYLFTIRR